MKKTVFLFVLVSFLFSSCSSDDNPTKELTPFPVKFKLNLKYQDNRLNQIGAREIFSDQRTPSDKMGRGGLLVYSSSTGLKAYDAACPVEWHRNYGLGRLENGLVQCYFKCKSEFNVETGKAVSGEAKSKGYSLVQYQITAGDADGVYNITNPRYKE